jgi:DNA-binding NtrC family response regulator
MHARRSADSPRGPSRSRDLAGRGPAIYERGVTERSESLSTVPDASQARGGAHVGVLLLAGAAPTRTQPGRIVRIPRGPAAVRIGRGSMRDVLSDEEGTSGSDVAVRLPDPLLSRAHLKVIRRAGGFEVMDEGSLNGVFLDGRRLERTVRLSDGSILCFGRHAAVFRVATEAELVALNEEARAPFGPIATMSPALASELALLRRLVRTDTEILLLGETGVGKEVYARALHRLSGRPGQFVALNCAAIPDELAESELFGHSRGAHPAAAEAKPGLVTTADDGTLFLDEIGDASPRLQAKLLRFLQDHEVRPVGGTSRRRIDVKVVAATNALGVGDGGLRGDLLARLGAEPVTIPPLRRRMEDLASLASLFAGGRPLVFEPAAHRAMYSYGWPHNVRELEKVVGRALALTGNGPIGLEHLPAAVREAARTGPPVAAGGRRQRPAPSPEVLKVLLAEHDGNVAAVARALDRQWTVVRRWVTKHDLIPHRARRAMPR